MEILLKRETVEREIKEFRQLLNPDAPEFKIVYAVDKLWTDEEYQLRKPSRFEYQQGVYLIYSNDGELVYIGSALQGFYSRVFMHDDKINRRHIEIIVIEEDYMPIILALEFFLISRLKPIGNTEYKNYNVPQIVSKQGLQDPLGREPLI